MIDTSVMVAGLLAPHEFHDVARPHFDRAVELNLGGDIHDALIAQTCLTNDVPLVTLDRRQHRVALALGAQSTYLLA